MVAETIDLVTEGLGSNADGMMARANPRGSCSCRFRLIDATMVGIEEILEAYAESVKTVKILCCNRCYNRAVKSAAEEAADWDIGKQPTFNCTLDDTACLSDHFKLI